jgi:hypothetical protein
VGTPPTENQRPSTTPEKVKTHQSTWDYVGVHGVRGTTAPCCVMMMLLLLLFFFCGLGSGPKGKIPPRDHPFSTLRATVVESQKLCSCPSGNLAASPHKVSVVFESHMRQTKLPTSRKQQPTNSNQNPKNNNNTRDDHGPVTG